jgi:hypothetical protein
MTAPDLSARGAAYTAFCAELRRQGPLWPAERDALLAAADALLFEEPEAAATAAAAAQLLGTLVANDRRTGDEAGRLREALLGCAAPVGTVALERVGPVEAPVAVREPGATHAS